MGAEQSCRNHGKLPYLGIIVSLLIKHREFLLERHRDIRSNFQLITFLEPKYYLEVLYMSMRLIIMIFQTAILRDGNLMRFQTANNAISHIFTVLQYKYTVKCY